MLKNISERQIIFTKGYTQYDFQNFTELVNTNCKSEKDLCFSAISLKVPHINTQNCSSVHSTIICLTPEPDLHTRVSRLRFLEGIDLLNILWVQVVNMDEIAVSVFSKKLCV